MSKAKKQQKNTLLVQKHVEAAVPLIYLSNF